jgi:beta-lactamase class A
MSIQAQIQSRLQAFDGRVGLLARDLDTGEELQARADEPFPSASLIKVAVMLEAFQQAADGRLKLGERVPVSDTEKVGGSGVLAGLEAGVAPTVADLVELMITISDNTATNLLIARVGTLSVEARLRALGLERTRLFRPTFRDGQPDLDPQGEREFGLGVTTPREMARLFELIATGRAVDAPSSARMLEILRRQQVGTMIPRGLPDLPGLQVGNKTGSDEEKQADAHGVKRHVRSDAAIVTGPGLRYVIVICARQIGDTSWGVDNQALRLGAELSRLVYEHFRARHPPM